MNPGFVEAHLRQHPLIDAALLFGHGRICPGVIIQLKPEVYRQFANVSDIEETLWKSVQEANRTSPTHFRIARQMLIVADTARPFAQTSKAQPRRRVVFEDYKTEIDAVYDASS